MDIWTTPAGDRSYLDIVASWVNIDHKNNNILIAFPPQYTDINITATIMEVIEEYGISGRVGYYMVDNASNKPHNCSRRLYLQFNIAILIVVTHIRVKSAFLHFLVLHPIRFL